ncbi:hypothetical protein [Sphingomonas sp. OTU376]|uniref:hypothetical protein n=1 Tax=Sphingomonas sp. OTU376 TaxID=3043863 RepID=UPI00313CCC8D
MEPANVPLEARGSAALAFELPFEVAGEPFDFTSYTGAVLEVRQYGAEAGDAIIRLNKVTSNVEGIRFIDPAEGILRFQFNRETLRDAYLSMIGANPAGSNLAFVYDLILTGPDGLREPWMEGTFTLKPGVSI